MPPPGDRSDLSFQCPVCRGTMEVVYDRPSQKVCVCTDCHSGLTIPASAWGIQDAKHRQKAKPEQ